MIRPDPLDEIVRILAAVAVEQFVEETQLPKEDPKRRRPRDGDRPAP